MLDDLWVGKVYATAFGIACALVGLGIGYILFHPAPRDDAALAANARQIAVVDTVHVIEQARTDTVREEVVRRTTIYRTDTLWRERTVTVNDTVFTLVSQPRLASIDSTIRACELLSDRVLAERTACGEAIRVRDERITLLERPDPWWKRRLGCDVGYGAVASGGEIRHGPGASCGLRLAF